ncbi:MAG: ParA family protein [Anaerolineales bacterium]|jgi:chromosome partitioning protein
MTCVITIANEKGGVAKTTTAVSLGAALAQVGQQVLVVDLDPQANLTLALGIRPKSVHRTITDILLGNQDIDSVSQETGVPGLFVAPSNQDLSMAERYLTVRDGYEFILRGALANASSHDFIIIDCPPALGPVTHSALVAANLLIIPTQCEFFSANALRDMLNMIRSVRQNSNPQLHYRVLMTMVDLRNRMHRSLLEQIHKAFGTAVFKTIIQTDTRLRESPLFSQPITVYAPSSRGAIQYSELAKEVMKYVHEFA